MSALNSEVKFEMLEVGMLVVFNINETHVTVGKIFLKDENTNYVIIGERLVPLRAIVGIYSQPRIEDL